MHPLAYARGSVTLAESTRLLPSRDRQGAVSSEIPKTFKHPYRTGRRVLIHRHAPIPDQQKHHARLGQSGRGLRHSGRAALLEETSIAGEGYRSGPVLTFERPFGAPKFVCRK